MNRNCSYAETDSVFQHIEPRRQKLDSLSLVPRSMRGINIQTLHSYKTGRPTPAILPRSAAVATVFLVRSPTSAFTDTTIPS